MRNITENTGLNDLSTSTLKMVVFTNTLVILLYKIVYTYSSIENAILAADITMATLVVNSYVLYRKVLKASNSKDPS